MTGLLALLMSLPALAADRHEVLLARGSDGAKVASFKVEVAADYDSRAKGLMFRKKLGKNAGMLFVYEEPGRRAFWMKDTFIPLDILFFTKKGDLVYIHPEAEPQKLAPIGPGRNDICAVLEIAGGEAARRGIRVGDRLLLEDDSACLP